MYNEPAWIEHMSHLPVERLAELADTEPTATECAHLAACPLCARERAAHTSLLALTNAERDITAMPLSRWDSLAPALRAEGLMSTARPARRWGATGSTGMRVAAAVLLLVTGALAGRMSAGGGGTEPVAMQSASALPLGANPVSDTLQEFGTREEALAVLARSAREYQQAIAYLGEREGIAGEVDSSSVYRTRLVALDGVMEATREALYDAPHDPVINRYYLATVGAREATLRQLNTALPVGTQLSRY